MYSPGSDAQAYAPITEGPSFKLNDQDSWVDTSPGTDWVFSELGTYTYLRRATAQSEWSRTDVVETYSEFISSDGVQRRVRAQRDASGMPAGVILRVEALIESHGFKQLEFELITDDGTAVSRARYEVDEQTLMVHREGIDGVQFESLTIPDGTVFLPLTRNFLGAVVAEVAQSQVARVPVLVPDLRDSASSTVFAPLVDLRSAQMRSRTGKKIQCAGQTWHTHEYAFEGGPYDGRSAFWLCSQSERLIRYGFVTTTGEEWLAELGDLVLENIR